MSQSVVIILNGVSSAGKTTLALALQDKLELPYYYLSQDMFSHLLSRRHRNQDFWGRTTQSISAMHHTMACFASLGFNVLADHVLLDTPHTKAWLDECIQLLHPYRVLFVEVWCPLEELERREVVRGNRQVGQARKQVAQSYPGSYYDISINTAENSLEVCVEQVIAFLNKPDNVSAFDKLYEIRMRALHV